MGPMPVSALTCRHVSIQAGKQAGNGRCKWTGPKWRACTHLGATALQLDLYAAAWRHRGMLARPLAIQHAHKASPVRQSASDDNCAAPCDELMPHT